MTPLRILIADDHAVVRAGLRALLEQQPDFDVVAEAESGAEAVRQAATHQPDIVVMDIRMPGGLSGIEACEQITDVVPQTKVIMLTAYSTEEVEKEADKHGISAFIRKPVSLPVLRQAVQESLGR